MKNVAEAFGLKIEEIYTYSSSPTRLCRARLMKLMGSSIRPFCCLFTLLFVALQIADRDEVEVETVGAQRDLNGVDERLNDKCHCTLSQYVCRKYCRYL